MVFGCSHLKFTIKLNSSVFAQHLSPQFFTVTAVTILVHFQSFTVFIITLLQTILKVVTFRDFFLFYVFLFVKERPPELLEV